MQVSAKSERLSKLVSTRCCVRCDVSTYLILTFLTAVLALLGAWCS